MFDVAPTELLLVAIVALLVIGPKDLPKAMRFVGHWVGRARGVARQFRSGFDAMVREAELAEMEKKWSEENARIMREHPSAPPVDNDLTPGDTHDYQPPVEQTPQPEISIEHPHVVPATADDPAPTADKAPS
jgi:sec-independent protein translocase protein TatB